MERLINWDPTSNSFAANYRNNPEINPAKIEALVNAPRNPAIAALVEAATAYFGAIGMHSICKLCFAGDPKITRLSGGHDEKGCCGGCALLGETHCVSKPVGCALWMCHYTSGLFPKAFALMDRVRKLLYMGRGTEPNQWAADITTSAVYYHGRLREQDTKVWPEMEKAAIAAAMLLKRETRKVQRTHAIT